ncbi:MAG: DNA polymerase-3 subunit gamma/tau [Candidatus Azotimanducaceae bacterium]|jgi:DNA polymerase-3 subunit gamma/tau
MCYEAVDIADRITTMSYEVLARKLRPAVFDSLVGQDHVVRALKHGLDHDRLHHAYLFTGTRGVGKTTIARILAKALNCEQGISSTPCETCSVCIQVKENRFVDLIEVDAASRTGVEATRDLLENAQYLPTVGRYKVYLIDEVHMLSNASFNALLKTLEEPPEHVKFLLATTDPKKVPVTVLSRCLQFQLKNLSRETIVNYLADALKGEDITFDMGALNIIARAASGSMRDALSLADQAIAFGQGALAEADVIAMLGVVGRSEVDELLHLVAKGGAQALMAASADLAEKNADFEDILRGMAEALHQLAVDVALNQRPVDAVDFSEEEIQLYYQMTLLGQRDLNLAPEPRSGFEMTLLRMLAFAPTPGSTVPSRVGDGPGKKPESVPPAMVDAPVEPAKVASNPEVPSPSPSPPEPEPEPEQAVVPPPAPPPMGDESWYDIVASVQVGGVTKMILDNSVPQKLAPPVIDLLLDERHETLLSESQIGQIKRALSEFLQQEVSLTIGLGTPGVETPAERNARLAQERQQAAEEDIKSDPKVTQLMSEFDASLLEVKPN